MRFIFCTISGWGFLYERWRLGRKRRNRIVIGEKYWHLIRNNCWLMNFQPTSVQYEWDGRAVTEPWRMVSTRSCKYCDCMNGANRIVKIHYQLSSGYLCAYIALFITAPFLLLRFLHSNTLRCFDLKFSIPWILVHQRLLRYSSQMRIHIWCIFASRLSYMFRCVLSIKVHRDIFW